LLRIRTANEADQTDPKDCFYTDPDYFPEFAFTGSRQQPLIQEITARMKKLKIEKMEVILGLDYEDDFEARQDRR
jgi:hypothetical protein